MTTRFLQGPRFVGVGILGAIVLLLALGTATVVSAPKQENVLDNPGFEEPQPANWESKDESCPGLWSYSWPSSPAHAGNRSVGIDINLSAYNGWWQSTPLVPITATRPYTFSGWIKAEGINSQAFLTLVFLDVEGREVLPTNSGVVSGSTDWVQVRPSGPVVAPVDVVSARIRCQLVGRGMAWYDDILLYPEPGDFPNLELTKSAQPIAVKAGELLTYTLRYSNTGNALARNVSIIDTLPPSVTVTYSSPPADEQPDPYTLIWNVGDLAEGGVPQTTTIIVTVGNAVADGQWLTNTATIVGDMAALTTAWITTEVTSSSNRFAHYLPVVIRNYPPPIVCNGGFEDGWNCWTHGGGLPQTITSANPHSGSFSALLGDPAYQCGSGVPLGGAWMEQTVLVPSAKTSPTLSFWYNIFTHDKNHDLSDTYDSFDVKINGVRVFRDMNTTNPYKCDNLRNLGWRQKTIDLSSYVGTYITIRFENWNRLDNWYNTWTYIDDVQIDP